MQKLRAFLEGPHRNQWITEGAFDIYVRKSFRSIDDRLRSGFDIASVQVREDVRGQGRFRALLAQLEEVLRRRQDYTYLAVCEVLNERLQGFLSRSGYELAPGGAVPPTYIKRLQAG